MESERFNIGLDFGSGLETEVVASKLPGGYLKWFSVLVFGINIVKNKPIRFLLHRKILFRNWNNPL